MFDTGEYTALTSYRNSQNFCANWISAGYALWFLRESRFLNRPRTQLGVNCAVSGTGFLVSAQAVREDAGWPYHLLTEDIEFSIACATRGRRIGYCGKAVIYDEQPEKFKQSWDQRLRWSKGLLSGRREVYRLSAARLHARRPRGHVLLRHADDGRALQPVHHRGACAVDHRMRDEPDAAGVYYIPRDARSGPHFLADPARHHGKACSCSARSRWRPNGSASQARCTRRSSIPSRSCSSC